MRLVLDTNVLIAAFVARGVCHELLEHCQHCHELVTSARLLTEFEEKLKHKFKTPPDIVREAKDLLGGHMERVIPSPLDRVVCRDPDDHWVLATAVVGRCGCIITGDKDLLILKSFQDIVILSPSEFWGYEAAQRNSG
ncbi:putative toxin-antitoxin system toxin component, PIN family [Synechococcales cyanobacterium C]|uniref:Putative toxin-antitoxin system toxin component, PIN family n=1 Tax=Petrachloros mirabilis ULC683 TaxID=2781853 RepID=A0A8K2AA24_9CYAN|nr:putative toxin-antitoxin system toxin component, PIN family [Petrachloros mirabilis]NCJ08720.1 putative toxin-antitoxin system toxin component, PIN family [Petrachloros mirabilis ULC683]